MSDGMDPRTEIGHVHLKVSDLERAVAFYTGALGFDVMQRMGTSAAFLSAGGYHHHIGLNTWESRRGDSPPPGTTGLYHFAIRYPTRAALATAFRRLQRAGVSLDGAADHGVSEALYLRDPDGNGIELYWDRPRAAWPHAADGSLRMVTEPLDLDSLLKEVEHPAPTAAGGAVSQYAPMSQESRQRLRDIRTRLLHLHKALLDDARAAYEMDRGRIASSGTFLQLVINDPWFAWLHPLSELVVRIDESVEPDSPATDADALALLAEVDRLLTASESAEGFPRRYFEALQRQPGVVTAHGEVKRSLRAVK